jgi:hypothetical protein
MLRRVGSHVRNQWMGALALFLVLAGGGAYAAFNPVGEDGDIDACFEKRSGDLDLLKGRKCGKGERPVSWSEVGPQGPQGEAGAQGVPGQDGQPGAPGADATTLFAYIRDTSSSADTTSIPYGHGVTAVTDPASADYVVTFDRSLANCVAFVVPGEGTPSGTGSEGFGNVHMSETGIPQQVAVEIRNGAGTRVDTPFLIAAFC